MKVSGLISFDVVVDGVVMLLVCCISQLANFHSRRSDRGQTDGMEVQSFSVSWSSTALLQTTNCCVLLYVLIRHYHAADGARKEDSPHISCFRTSCLHPFTGFSQLACLNSSRLHLLRSGAVRHSSPDFQTHVHLLTKPELSLRERHRNMWPGRRRGPASKTFTYFGTLGRLNGSAVRLL